MLRSAALTAAITAVVAVGQPNAAQAQANGIGSLDQVDLGQHWYGPKRSNKDLQGRVVMIELWGFN